MTLEFSLKSLRFDFREVLWDRNETSMTILDLVVFRVTNSLDIFSKNFAPGNGLAVVVVVHP